MRAPGQRVAMEPNGPRTSEGASGFGSHVSSWLGPPTNSSRITDRSAGTSSEDPRAKAGAKDPSQPRPRPPRRKHRADPDRDDPLCCRGCVHAYLALRRRSVNRHILTLHSDERQVALLKNSNGENRTTSQIHCISMYNFLSVRELETRIAGRDAPRWIDRCTRPCRFFRL